MNKFIYLNYINELRLRLDAKKDLNLIQVVLGPRQVGKTTTILKLIEEYYKTTAHYVSAEQIFNASSSWLREHWQYAISNDKIFFIDEIQKIFNWSEAIKVLYDETKRSKKRIRCVLLGSSSLAIQKGLSESLTGRFQQLQAYHWNYHESKEGYDLTFEDYLQFGGYPGSYPLINSNDWVDYVSNSIINTVIEKDILQYNTVKNPALFKQAFEIIISYPAQEISYTKLLGQIQEKGNVELVKYYLSLYQGAFLIKTLEKYSEKKINIKSSSPKIMPLAPCLPYLQIRDKYKLEERGRVFEAIVGAQLLRTRNDLYYWREGSHEVDFVLKSGRALWGIEVKSGRKKSLKGIEKFKKKFARAKTVIVSPENYLEFEREPMMFLEKHAQ